MSSLPESKFQEDKDMAFYCCCSFDIVLAPGQCLAQRTMELTTRKWMTRSTFLYRNRFVEDYSFLCQNNTKFSVSWAESWDGLDEKWRGNKSSWEQRSTYHTLGCYTLNFSFPFFFSSLFSNVYKQLWNEEPFSFLNSPKILNIKEPWTFSKALVTFGKS